MTKTTNLSITDELIADGQDQNAVEGGGGGGGKDMTPYSVLTDQRPSGRKGENRQRPAGFRDDILDRSKEGEREVLNEVCWYRWLLLHVGATET